MLPIQLQELQIAERDSEMIVI